MHVILFEPEIPPNTGNIIRLCANTGATLHLVEPLGFRLDARSLRRAGLDYHEIAAVQVHADLAACREALGESRLFAIETSAERLYSDARFREDDALLFGPESRGLPAGIVASLEARQVLRIPMLPGNRSLNLSNAVAIVVYEAWRQFSRFRCGSRGP